MKYALVLALIYLSACPSSETNVKTKPTSSETPKVEEAAKKEVPEKMPIKEILLSESGVGRLGSASAFKLETIQEAFGGYDVEKAERSMEGTAYNVFLVKKGEEIILEISSDDEKKVSEILARSSSVNNQLGARVGATFKSVFPEMGQADCIRGADDSEALYFCRIPKVKNVRYRFEGNEKDKRKLDGDWVLEAVEWRKFAAAPKAPVPKKMPQIKDKKRN